MLTCIALNLTTITHIYFRASTNLCMDTSNIGSHKAQRRFQRSLWGIPRRLYNYSVDPSCKNLGCRNVLSRSREPKWQGKSRLRSYCPGRPARLWMWHVSESRQNVHMHSFLYWVSSEKKFVILFLVCTIVLLTYSTRYILGCFQIWNLKADIAWELQHAEQKLFFF